MGCVDKLSESESNLTLFIYQFKLSMSLMKLAFNMESWEACGGGPELTGSEALAEGNRYIDKALKIFQELNDMGHYAEALMTKGVLAPRGSMEQLKVRCICNFLSRIIQYCVSPVYSSALQNPCWSDRNDVTELSSLQQIIKDTALC